MGMLSVVITLWRLDVSIAERRRPLDMGCIIVMGGQGPGASTASLAPLITGSLHYNYTITSY